MHLCLMELHSLLEYLMAASCDQIVSDSHLAGKDHEFAALSDATNTNDNLLLLAPASSPRAASRTTSKAPLVRTHES